MLAHAGQPLSPHDLWRGWNLDPVLLAGLLVAVAAFRRGIWTTRRRRELWRERCFHAALITISVALVSPLDALSGALASAHMVQHVLLVLVAAPLLALSRPMTTLLHGGPAVLRTVGVRWRRRLGLTRGTLRLLRHPIAVWLLHVATLWFWHASVPYNGAVEHHPLHVLEHATFVITAVLFWRAVIGTRIADRVSHGFGVLLVFAMAMQSVFLSALLTFAAEPWYSVYASTTSPWRLDPLADQQLAGVIMWVPAGLVYLGAALSLLHVWLGNLEREDLLSSM